MKQYIDLLKDVLDNGTERDDRTGVGTISVFGRQIRFDMQKGFPIVTTKKVFFGSVVSELLWFLEGSTNEHRLAEIKNDNKTYDQLTYKEKHTIWTDNFDKQGRDLGYTDGELGPVYGSQWRHFVSAVEVRDRLSGSKDLYNVYYVPVTKDQIADVIEQIKTNPTSRRLLVSAWNAGVIDQMALPPCHYAFQFYVDGDKLSLMWNQRSVDSATGLPFNISSYALLLCIVARMTNKIPYELIGNLGDTHIYKNHIDNVKIQIKRTPHELPQLQLPENADYSNIDSFLKSVKTSDFKLLNYEHDEALKYPMAV